jgi:NTP pyrophosphatase (non-canonical NTP hydrolase)
MTLNQYQEAAKQTAIYKKEHKIFYTTFGLVSEAGEVAGKVKKVMRDNNNRFKLEDLQEIAKELGDVLWYVATLADDIGIDLEDIARINIQKLTARKEKVTISGSGDNR